jgi:hypothetical protein
MAGRNQKAGRFSRYMRMIKRPVFWKPVKTKNVYGGEFTNPYLPSLLAEDYKGTLLSAILAMPCKQPISFQEAANLASAAKHKAVVAKKFGYKPGECFWFYRNFVQWISDQGYHIELTGDEFEAYALSDKVS